MSTDKSKTNINLADPRLGAAVIYATDDFFAPKERLIKPEDPVFIPGKYDDHGKWMDGWESRRKRTPGHDYCIVWLGQPGIIAAVDIDTRHFTGNYPPEASLEACVWHSETPNEMPGEKAIWTEIVSRRALNGNSQHLIDVDAQQPYTHLRLHMYPDGGIARLRVYGQVHRGWLPEDASKTVDLLAAKNGGRPIFANDEHFGTLANLMAPGKGINMGDGWETRRRREPGNDWAVVALGHRGVIEDILVDTAYFKGNYPAAVSLQGTSVTTTDTDAILKDSESWPLLLEKNELGPDAEHSFKPTADGAPITHVRINIFPDGGISRLRLFGKPVFD